MTITYALHSVLSTASMSMTSQRRNRLLVVVIRWIEQLEAPIIAPDHESTQ